MSATVRLCVLLAAFTFVAVAAEIRGTVFDPSEAAIAGAQVSALSRLGVVAQTATDQTGAFTLSIADPAASRLVVTAPGFETKTVPLDSAVGPLVLRLNLAAQTDSVRVVGSAIDTPLSEQGGSVSVIPGTEIRERNEPFALDLLRYLPGITINQSGQRGGLAGLYIRGGDPNYTLVQIDGVTVNAFGGGFDFAHLPADALERIEVIRGSQSAVYGPYANSGVVNFVSRTAENAPKLDLLAEGGSHQERRFAIGAAGHMAGFGVAAFASRLDANGPVSNSDYRNENVSLSIDRRFARQALFLHGNLNANETGEPGPYGSDPQHHFNGLDLVSRAKNNFSDYIARYQVDLTPRVREEISGSFFQNNNGFRSRFGFSFNKDLRSQGEARTVVSASRNYTMALGASFAHEQVENAFVTDDSFDTVPLRRNEEGIYWENRLQAGARLFVNAGVRADIVHTREIPANTSSGRPRFPDNTVAKVNPKIAAAWMAAGGLRLHGSFGMGLRPPSGFDLAFTNNPQLKPERTTSFDLGVEQRLFHDRVSMDATYFYNRYRDLIVILGGSLARLSRYQSDNLANSRAQGLELAARVRPARQVALAASYTYVNSEILSLSGAAGTAPSRFRVGQELVRRPAHSGSAVAMFTQGRWTTDVTGYFRGSTLDVDPSLGASGGFFRNPGYADVGVNLNYRVAASLTLYSHLRNALNRYYEETFGFPAPKLNFVTGVKWTLARGR
jgi:outer membrane cobalamin receptor